MKDAEFKRRSESSNQTTKLLNDDSLQEAELLSDAFLKAFHGVKGVDDSLLEKIENCKSMTDYSDLLRLLKLRTNGALLARDRGIAIATSRKKEFGCVSTPTAWPITICSNYLAVHWKIQELLNERQKIEQAVHGLNIYLLNHPPHEHGVDWDFMKKNIELLSSQTIWCSEDPELVANYAEDLRRLRAAMNAWSLEPNPSLDTSDDLEALIAASQKKVELQALFDSDEIFKNVGFLYAPMVVTGRIDLQLEERDWTPVTEDYKYTQTNLHIDLPLPRLIHCFVVTKPDKKAVIVTPPKDYVLEVRATRDLAWGQEYFRLEKPVPGILRDVDDLAASIERRKK